MYVPLLEALLKKDLQLSLSCVEESYRSSNDDREVFKAIFIYASQHSANSQPDALTICWLYWLVVKSIPEERTITIEGLLSFLMHIQIVPIDTSVLKPDVLDSSIVSVHDLYDSFEKGDQNDTLKVVGRTLKLMDNKNYFTEILTDIALTRSASSIILTRAFYDAVDVLGWNNHFTPFLIYHIVVRIHSDHKLLSKKQAGDVENVLLTKSLERIGRDSKIIRSKLTAKIQAREFGMDVSFEPHLGLIGKAVLFV